MKVAVCMNTTLVSQQASVAHIREAYFHQDGEAGYVAEADSIAALHFAFSVCGEEDTITAVSYGGVEQEAALEYALAYGVTSLLRIADDGSASSLGDPMVTAQILASAIQDQGFDMVVCGNPSSTGAMPAMLAQYLGMPCVSRVYAVEKMEGTFKMQQRLERGWRQHVTVTLPVLVTVQAGFFSPMYISVKRRRSAKKNATALIETMSAPSVGQGRVQLQTVNAPKPRAKRKAMPDAKQSAGNRLQSLMGGGGSSAGKSLQKDKEEEKVREVAPEQAAQEIIDFLKKKEFLADTSKNT